MQRYRATENCRRLIEHYEGRKREAYACPAGITTIGVGHTKGVRIGDAADDDQIDRWFYEDVAVCEMHVNDLNLKINQQQFDALVSFVFNLGIGSLLQSTLVKRIKNHSMNPEIRDQLLRWNKAKDSEGKLVDLEGLTKRRKSEAEMYFTGNLILS